MQSTPILTRVRERVRAGFLALLALAALAAGCTTLPFEATQRDTTQAYAQPERSALAQLIAPAIGGADAQQTGLRLLASGNEAFAARAVLAESAEHTLDLQYHIVENDNTATLLLHRALRAAARGVRVRVLIDDIASALPESDLAALSLHPRIEVRLFNPFHLRGSVSRWLELLGNSQRLNRRMHNKLWIADNVVAVIGGRNLGDAYFDALPQEGFADLDLLVGGLAVREASASFDRYWNSAWAVPLAEVVARPLSPLEASQRLAELEARAEAFRAGDYARAARASALVAEWRSGQLAMTVAPTRIHADLPPDRETPSADNARARPIFEALREAVTAARHELILVSPYFVPSDLAVQIMCGLSARGVAVRVLTNSLASTDVPAVHSGYARHRPQLLACGAQLHELRPATDAAEGGEALAPTRRRLSSGASLHAKAIVVDREQVFMGSMNLDPRSRQINTEIALQAHSRELGARLGELFDESVTLDQVYRVELQHRGDASAPLRWHGLEGGRAVVETSEPLASPWRRAAAVLLGWLIDEDLL